MRNGQVTSAEDGYRLAIHGTRMPIQWLMGTDGWAMFIHQPYGAFDFKGAEGRFTPRARHRSNEHPPSHCRSMCSSSARLEPAAIMREYARITGLPEMPPMWAFGYQQSSRTLDGPKEILGVAKTFREKKLPCDTLIYLGTEFTPSGWNTRNGEFTWHQTNFPDPKGMIDTIHADHFKVVVHVVIEGRQLTGRVSDPCTAEPLPPGRTAGQPLAAVAPGVVLLAGAQGNHSTLALMGSGPIKAMASTDRRDSTGTACITRARNCIGRTSGRTRCIATLPPAFSASEDSSGRVTCRRGGKRSRRTFLSRSIPASLGLPYWGTDIGGFNPTEEYTAELHVRWFQFGAFNPLMRAHGRQWHLRLPWGWDGGDGGPVGDGAWKVNPEELKRPDVETISRKYLELRYRLMPYLQTAVREAHETGLADHARALAALPGRPGRGRAGRRVPVGPRHPRGASRREGRDDPEGVSAARHVDRLLDGECPSRVAARSTARSTLRPCRSTCAPAPSCRTGPSSSTWTKSWMRRSTLIVYPGADGSSTWYEDDGKSFLYRAGAFMKVAMTWRDATRRLTLELAPGGRMLPPMRRQIVVRMAGKPATKTVTFEGKRVEVDCRSYVARAGSQARDRGLEHQAALRFGSCPNLTKLFV